MDNKQALNEFLLYSYFGYNSKELAQGGKEKCAYRAYLDLARTVNYCYSASELNNAKSDSEEAKFKAERDKQISCICKKLIESIEKYPEDSDDFESWHKNKCTQISKDMDKFIEEGFTFTLGQAQKWLNMTLKYLWLLDMLPDGISTEMLHVPIDSFILEKLKQTGKFKENGNKITGSGTSYYYNNETWSTISEQNDYDKLQYSIRKIAEENRKSPIEWEGPAWMEIAKQRNNK